MEGITVHQYHIGMVKESIQEGHIRTAREKDLGSFSKKMEAGDFQN